MIRSLVLALALVSLTGGGALAQAGEVTANRLIFVGGGGLSGQITLRSETETAFGTVETELEDDLDAAGHLGLQYESPIAPFFVLGYRFMAVRYDVDDNLDRNRTFFDFGIAPTATMAFGAGNLSIEPRLGLPLGFSLHRWNDDDDPPGEVSQLNAGFHIGFLAGVHLGASNPQGAGRLGGLFELGFIHHSAFASEDDPDIRYRLSTNQFVLQAGLSLAL